MWMDVLLLVHRRTGRAEGTLARAAESEGGNFVVPHRLHSTTILSCRVVRDPQVHMDCPLTLLNVGVNIYVIFLRAIDAHPIT